MSKVRVYEVARDLKVDQEQLVSLLQSLGFNDVRNRMSKVDADAVERVKRHIENEQKTPKVVEERLSATVVKRRRVGAPKRPSTPSASPRCQAGGGQASCCITSRQASQDEASAGRTGGQACGEGRTCARDCAGCRGTRA